VKIISISGLDGSGKSTQLKHLRDFLESQGKKVFYFHAIQFSVANFLRRKELPGNRRGVTKANRIKIILRLLAMEIDILRFGKLIKKLENEEYDFIISDRFFQDSLINITFLMGKNNPPEIEKRLPRPDIAFYLKTDPEAIMERRRAPEQGLAYLTTKKGLYDKFSGAWNMTVIDGNRDQETIFKEIRTQLDKI
jgi:thymidylate kinase